MPETLAQCYELIDDLQTEVQNLKKQINETTLFLKDTKVTLSAD